MHWRLSKPNWTYAVGELLIVASGVLIALAVDQWNSSRLDRLDESAIIQRLISDISIDLEVLDFEASMVEKKEASLLRLRSALLWRDRGSSDPRRLLDDIMTGSNFGWNQSSARRTTYDELLSSGRFSLIAQPEIRALVAFYYDDFEDRVRRMDERETEFPHLSYRLVPRQYVDPIGDESQVQLDSALDTDEINRLVARVRDSDIANHIDAEINLARFIMVTNLQQVRLARELIGKLEDYARSF